MTLKKDFDFIGFMRALEKCSGEVFLCTGEKDKLNLQSMLARFVFATLIESPEVIGTATILCEDPADYECLKECLKED